MIILISITSIIFLLTVYCVYKKSFQYLFIPLVLFLPDYYGIEINSTLPIFSVKRILFVIFFAYCLFVCRQSFFSNVRKNTKQMISSIGLWFILYFIFRLVSNMFYFFRYNDAKKTILYIILEEFFFLFFFLSFEWRKENIIRLIKSIVIGSSVMFVLGLVESITTFRVTDYLYTVSRELLNDHYIRLGLLRSTVTMGLPGFYGNFCVLVFPLIIYLINNSNKYVYSLIAILDVFSCIHSGSRSSLFFLMTILFIHFLYVLIKKERIKEAFTNFALSFCTFVLLLVLFCNISERLNYFYVGSAKSLLNEIGFNYDLDKGAPDGVEGYGVNANSGTYSRQYEFSGIYYAAKVNPIFGLGSKAQNRGDVFYLRKGKWKQVRSYDVGYVQSFMDEGILGWAAYLCILIGFCVMYKKALHCQKLPYLNQCLLLMMIAYLLCILATANMNPFLFTIILLLLINNQKNTQNNN